MKTPRAELTVNGRAVASLFNERLVSVTIIDKEGVSSDSIRCELNDGNPFAAIPEKGDAITARLGFLETGLAEFGPYTIDDPEIQCLPYKMLISGRGTNIRDDAKQHRSRHWDRQSVGEIVSEIAADLGLQASIDSEIGAHVYEWFGQQDESDLHVLERLARRHDALFSIKGDRVVFARKGSGKAASGGALTAVVATPDNIVEGTCRVTYDNRKRYRKVRARVQDRNQAKLLELEVESDPDGTADYTMPEPFADEGEARRAAGAKAQGLKSETMRTRVTLNGDPTIRAGASFQYRSVRPGVDGILFIIESATHRLSKAGYVVEVDAKLRPSSDSGGNSTGSGGEGAVPSASESVEPDGNGTGQDQTEAPPIPSLPGGIGHA